MLGTAFLHLHVQYSNFPFILSFLQLQFFFKIPTPFSFLSNRYIKSLMFAFRVLLTFENYKKLSKNQSYFHFRFSFLFITTAQFIKRIIILKFCMSYHLFFQTRIHQYHLWDSLRIKHLPCSAEIFLSGFYFFKSSLIFCS